MRKPNPLQLARAFVKAQGGTLGPQPKCECGSPASYRVGTANVCAACYSEASQARTPPSGEAQT